MPIPTIKIEYTPSWDSWAEIAEAVWVTALEGGCSYWMDDVFTGGNNLKQGQDIIGDFPITVHYGDEGWGDGESETIKALAFSVVVDGINALPAELKMQIGNPSTCDIDAEQADMIIQFGLFGEQVYG